VKSVDDQHVNAPTLASQKQPIDKRVMDAREMGSGFSNGKWLCCSLFALSAHSSPENLLTCHLIGKCPETWAAFALKYKHLPRIMSIGRNVPGKAASHLASPINIL
jgi:hypothetical protein